MSSVGAGGPTSSANAGRMIIRLKSRGERKLSAAQGLVWVGDAELQGYFRRRHPQVRWARHAVSTSGEAYTRGQTAGRNIVLHRGVKSGSGAVIRQLPPKR